MCICGFCDHCEILSFECDSSCNSICSIFGDKIHTSDEACDFYTEVRDFYNIVSF